MNSGQKIVGSWTETRERQWTVTSQFLLHSCLSFRPNFPYWKCRLKKIISSLLDCFRSVLSKATENKQNTKEHTTLATLFCNLLHKAISLSTYQYISAPINISQHLSWKTINLGVCVVSNPIELFVFFGFLLPADTIWVIFRSKNDPNSLKHSSISGIAIVKWRNGFSLSPGFPCTLLCHYCQLF